MPDAVTPFLFEHRNVRGAWVEIEFGVEQLCLETRNRGVNAANFGFIGEPRFRFRRLSLGKCLFSRVDVTRGDIERRLGYHLSFEQLSLPGIFILRELNLNLHFFDD